MSSDDAYAAFLDKANEDPAKNTPTTQQQGQEEHVQTRTTDPSQCIPTVLSDVEMYYTSDTDEVFEPVALDWSGAAAGRWPGVGIFLPLSSSSLSSLFIYIHMIILTIPTPKTDEFKSLILPSSSTRTFSASAAAEAEDMQISILTPSSFDPKNHYATVLHAVRTAVNGGNERDMDGVEVKVYRVQMGRTRAEYWVVGLDRCEGDGKGGRIVGLRAKAIES